MKRKKLVALFACMVLSLSVLSGCGNQNQDDESKQESISSEKNTEEASGEKEEAKEEVTGGTVASDLYLQFQTEIKNSQDLDTVAKALMKNQCFGEVSLDSIPVEEGYLNGFDAEITGFNEGICFAPYIGSIPFVGYLFETDTPDVLLSDLKEHAQLNWNICTEADEMLGMAEGNYVFFVMAPKSFDEE